MIPSRLEESSETGWLSRYYIFVLAAIFGVMVVGFAGYALHRDDSTEATGNPHWGGYIKLTNSDSSTAYIGFYDGKIDYRGSLEITDAAQIFLTEVNYFMEQELRTERELREFETRELRNELRRCYKMNSVKKNRLR